jgi:ClpP class serine protease
MSACAPSRFEIDSPGGEVAGCFDLVDMIFNARGMQAHVGHP